jgi:hypothetical protein
MKSNTVLDNKNIVVTPDMTKTIFVFLVLFVVLLYITGGTFNVKLCAIWLIIVLIASAKYCERYIITESHFIINSLWRPQKIPLTSILEVKNFSLIYSYMVTMKVNLKGKNISIKFLQKGASRISRRAT